MDITSSADLLISLGQEVHIFRGERNNLKVTTPEDLSVLESRYYYEHNKPIPKIDIDEE